MYKPFQGCCIFLPSSRSAILDPHSLLKKQREHMNHIVKIFLFLNYGLGQKRRRRRREIKGGNDGMLRGGKK